VVVTIKQNKQVLSLNTLRKQEEFVKCWAHSPQPDVASGTVARRLRIDVHDIDNDDNDNDKA